MGATDADVGPDGTGIQDLKENVTSNDHIAVQRDGAWLSILIFAGLVRSVVAEITDCVVR